MPCKNILSEATSSTASSVHDRPSVYAAPDSAIRDHRPRVPALVSGTRVLLSSRSLLTVTLSSPAYGTLQQLLSETGAAVPCSLPPPVCTLISFLDFLVQVHILDGPTGLVYALTASGNPRRGPLASSGWIAHHDHHHGLGSRLRRRFSLFAARFTHPYQPGYDPAGLRQVSLACWL